MTLNDHKEYISLMLDTELVEELEMYTELQSASSRDQTFLALLEDEVFARGLETFDF